MGRLIDADVLKEYIDAQKGRPFIGCTIGEALKIMTDEQPTVEAIPFKWIPFSEQKPSKTDDYLITYPISHEHAYVAIDQWLAEEGKWEAFRTDAVIAWAEIPKPYGGES